MKDYTQNSYVGQRMALVGVGELKKSTKCIYLLQNITENLTHQWDLSRMSVAE